MDKSTLNENAHHGGLFFFYQNETRNVESYVYILLIMRRETTVTEYPECQKTLHTEVRVQLNKASLRKKNLT